MGGAKFCDFSFRRFGFIVRTDRQTDRQRCMHDCYTHATTAVRKAHVCQHHHLIQARPIYRVGQIKQDQLSFLLVTIECIDKIQYFLARTNYIRQQVARCQLYLNESVRRQTAPCISQKVLAKRSIQLTVSGIDYKVSFHHTAARCSSSDRTNLQGSEMYNGGDRILRERVETATMHPDQKDRGRGPTLETTTVYCR